MDLACDIVRTDLGSTPGTLYAKLLKDGPERLSRLRRVMPHVLGLGLGPLLRHGLVALRNVPVTTLDGAAAETERDMEEGLNGTARAAVEMASQHREHRAIFAAYEHRVKKAQKQRGIGGPDSSDQKPTQPVEVVALQRPALARLRHAAHVEFVEDHYGVEAAEAIKMLLAAGTLSVGDLACDATAMHAAGLLLVYGTTAPSITQRRAKDEVKDEAQPAEPTAPAPTTTTTTTTYTEAKAHLTDSDSESDSESDSPESDAASPNALDKAATVSFSHATVEALIRRERCLACIRARCGPQRGYIAEALAVAPNLELSRADLYLHWSRRARDANSHHRATPAEFGHHVRALLADPLGFAAATAESDEQDDDVIRLSLTAINLELCARERATVVRHRWGEDYHNIYSYLELADARGGASIKEVLEHSALKPKVVREALYRLLGASFLQLHETVDAETLKLTHIWRADPRVLHARLVSDMRLSLLNMRRAVRAQPLFEGKQAPLLAMLRLADLCALFEHATQESA